MNTKEGDDEQFEQLRVWMGERRAVHRNPKGIRWLVMLFAGVALILFALAVANMAQAQTKPWDSIELTWSDDGSCGSFCPTQGFELQGADTPTATIWTAIASFAPTARQSMQNNVGAGQHCYRLILVGTGMKSAASNVTCKTAVQPIPPKPPTLQVIAQTAYKLDSGYTDQYKLVAIGMVPFGAPCKPQEVLGLNVVSRKLLKPDPGKSVPLQVLAGCRPI